MVLWTRSRAYVVRICVAIALLLANGSAAAMPLHQGTYRIPLQLLSRWVVETDAPGCRWPHALGTVTVVSFSWGTSLQTPGLPWRIAFESAVADWNSSPTKMLFIYSPDGAVRFNTYSAQDGLGGISYPYCGSANNTFGYSVWGNLYYDSLYSYSTATRLSTTSHEAGHSLSLGHISDVKIALLGYNPDTNIYYRPQPLDVILTNQVYP